MGCSVGRLRLNCLTDTSVLDQINVASTPFGRCNSTYSPMEKTSKYLDPTERAANEYQTSVAAATLIGTLSHMDRGSFTLEKRSVYGAAILMPQLARTAKWPKYLTFAVFRAYIFLLSNITMQGWLLYMIMKEENVMDLFSGQMYLCDFGSDVVNCPGEPGCKGPGGTEITAPRMYDYTTWMTRTFVRDSLIDLFPDKKQEIMDRVDPGEYGVESHWCRWVCCFIFMMTVMNELLLIMHTVRLLWVVPTRDDAWLSLRESDDQPDQSLQQSKLVRGESPAPMYVDVTQESTEFRTRRLSTDEVRIQIAGMPYAWKVINVIIVLVPKVLLWKITAQSGVMFLMETSGIEDIIVNSVGLAFVLNIDEMMCETLMSESTQQMLSSLEDYCPSKVNLDEGMAEDELLDKYGRMQAWSLKGCCLHDLLDFFPWKLMLSLVLTVLFIFEYYNRNCKLGEGGKYVSQDIYLPKSVMFSFWNAFFPNFAPIPAEDEPAWQMPTEE